MRKDTLTELWQLKAGITAMIDQLNEGSDHLDILTCRVLARALDEFLQETISLPQRTTSQEIEQFAKEILTGTEEIQNQLADKWYDDLQPIMHRSQQRAEALDHDLGDFTCISVDGQKWGAICIKCLEWVVVQPNQASGALLNSCNGWLTGLPF